VLAEALREVQRALSALRGDLRARPSLNVEELREVVRAEVNRLMLERDITGEVMALKKQVAGIAEELERVSKALDSLGQRVAELEPSTRWGRGLRSWRRGCRLLSRGQLRRLREGRLGGSGRSRCPASA